MQPRHVRVTEAYAKIVAVLLELKAKEGMDVTVLADAIARAAYEAGVR